jgi:uncharacterized protein YbjT (DUF2867 family)
VLPSLAGQKGTAMILVTGATGTIGRALIRQLKARELPFKAFVRSESKGAALQCEYAIGDFDQADTVARALEGIDAVFVNGPAGEHLPRQQSALFEAAQRAGVKRIVKISTRGADPSSHVSLARGHGLAEQALAESRVPWTVLRPSTFMQNLLRSAPAIRNTGKIFGAYGAGRIAFIDCEDIAACATQTLLDSKHAGQIFTLTGPSAHSYSEVAASCAAALGKPVEYIDLPPEQMLEQLKAAGTPEVFATMMVKLMVTFSKGGGGETTTSVQDLLGRVPRDLGQFFKDNVAAFR